MAKEVESVLASRADSASHSVSILQRLLGSPQIDWHLAIHGVVLTVVVMIGGGIYADHLGKIATERNTTLPPLESESD